MEGLKYDPKQIVTPDAFRVDPKLLGKPLATPKRRFAAVIIDLVIAGILTLFNYYLLAALATLAVVWIIIRKKTKTRTRKGWRIAFAVAGSIFIFVGTYALIKETSTQNEKDGVLTAGEVLRSEEFTELMDEAMAIDETNNPESKEELQEEIEEFTEEMIKKKLQFSPDSIKVGSKNSFFSLYNQKKRTPAD